MIHYHGTPITPNAKLYEIAGRHFCVSFFRPDQMARVEEQAQSLMIDNGAFSHYRLGQPKFEWDDYYAWCDPYLDRPTTWAVIPDVIDAGSQEQDYLLSIWPHEDRGAPVWHMDEPISRLLHLLDHWPKVCIGSTGEFWVINSPAWKRRMDEIWNAVAARHRRTPWIHMLRGMQMSLGPWPFASGDSTDIAQNHNRAQNTPSKMANRWDAAQPPRLWTPQPSNAELFGETA